MLRHPLVIAALLAALVTGAGIVALDSPIAVSMAALGGRQSPWLGDAMGVLELLTGLTLPRYVLGGSLAGIGLFLWRPWQRAVPKRWRTSGRAAIFVGLTHLLVRVGGGMTKGWFGRLRPFEALAAGDLEQTFFRPGGNAMPSGHVLHIAALAFSLGVVRPRTLWLSMPVLAFVAVARIATIDHFFSDVTGALAVAALGTLLLRPIAAS